LRSARLIMINEERGRGSGEEYSYR